ncbi:hypothetical protein PoB_005609800 [Plakobranchus ocellatus]|uniref:Mutator-like transposase domain-containing protein n=1 Tax=Plakobranchus ocellatus TaxID=259542 RepID=A0AAV4CF44_9GAST|nr:hypothetical protein PoB_005609800 [Plakobranchus ocellatus]
MSLGYLGPQRIWIDYFPFGCSHQFHFDFHCDKFESSCNFNISFAIEHQNFFLKKSQLCHLHQCGKIGESVSSVQPRVDDSPTGYAIVDLAVVAELFTPFTCSLCSSKLSLRANPNSRCGFAHYLTVVCSGCGNIEASSMTSKLLTGGKQYEVNRKVVLSFVEAGLGYAGLNTICEMMGMTSMTAATHASHISAIHKTSENSKTALMDEVDKKGFGQPITVRQESWIWLSVLMEAGIKAWHRCY